MAYRLLGALDAADARAEQAEAERAVIAEELAAYDENDVEAILVWARQEAQKRMPITHEMGKSIVDEFKQQLFEER
jgi:RecA-family ATPase